MRKRTFLLLTLLEFASAFAAVRGRRAQGPGTVFDNILSYIITNVMSTLTGNILVGLGALVIGFVIGWFVHYQIFVY